MKHEMQWTVNWFRWMVGRWRQILDMVKEEERPPRLNCYCNKQMVLWGSLADQAQTKFSKALCQPLYW
jgi:hypothetical protein